ERYIGPPLGNVLLRRSPAYTMNMMMNPTEMSQRHPVAKALLAEYLAPMPFQDLSEQDARALVEYLRTVADSTKPMGYPEHEHQSDWSEDYEHAQTSAARCGRNRDRHAG